jgi:hypothetical protein
MIVELAPADSWPTICLGALNVVQAVALAYIAARWRNGRRR